MFLPPWLCMVITLIFKNGKGQIKLKAYWRVLDSPKKQTNKFVLFTFLLFTANKTNSFIRFLEESTTFGFIWLLVFHFSELSIWLANFYSSRGIKYVHSFLSKGNIALASKKEAFLCVFTAVPFDYGTLFSFRDGVLALFTY